MKPYTFGYLFVRLNKTLAILTVICGLGLLVLLYFQHSFEAEAAAYSSSDVLELRLQNLKSASDQAEFRIKKFLNVQAFPAGYEAANSTPEFQSHYTNTSSFEQLHQNLFLVNAARKAAKTFLTKEFDNSLNDIRSKLLAHAHQLDASLPQQPVNTASPSRTISATQTQAQDELFSSLSKDEIEGRKTVLSEAIEILHVLESAAESNENKAVLGRSIDEVSRFTDLLPAILEVEAKQDSPADVPDQPVKKVFNAQKVALQLAQIQTEVDDAVTSAWAVDEAYDKATESYAEEFTKCRDAEHQVKRVWRDCAMRIVEALICSIGLAFALMVLADLTKAILDTAASGATVAAAYTAVREEDPPE